MFGQPVEWSHVGILTTTYSRYAVRGGSGLVFLLVFLLVGLSVAGFLIDPVKQRVKDVQRKGKQFNQDIEDEDVVKNLATFMRPVVAWWVGADEQQDRFRVKKKDPFVEHLVVDRSPILSAYLLVILAFIPFTTCLGAFNQLSGDIGTKGLRYLLLRTERINVIVARFLGTVLFTMIIMAFVMGVVVFYIAVTFESQGVGTLLGWGFHGWLALVLFSLPYVCLCTLLSASMDSPIATLVLCLLATGFPILFLKYAGIIAGGGGKYGWLERLTPWGWKYELLHPHLSKMMASAGVMVGFSALLWLAAVRLFLKRDL